MWISVNDRLPDEGQRVIVYKTGNEPRVMLSYWTADPYPSEAGHFCNGFAFEDDRVFRAVNDGPVTYWTPQPDSPA